MITGQLKRDIDRLWLEFWQGGITNPLTVIEQITFLMFARLLDIQETADERRFARTQQPFRRDLRKVSKGCAGKTSSSTAASTTCCRWYATRSLSTSASSPPHLTLPSQ